MPITENWREVPLPQTCGSKSITENPKAILAVRLLRLWGSYPIPDMHSPPVLAGWVMLYYLSLTWVSRILLLLQILVMSSVPETLLRPSIWALCVPDLHAPILAYQPICSRISSHPSLLIQNTMKSILDCSKVASNSSWTETISFVPFSYQYKVSPKLNTKYYSIGP